MIPLAHTHMDRDRDKERPPWDEPPPAYSSVCDVRPGEPSETPSSENVSPQPPRRIPDPVSYESPSHSETQPRIELMRAAAHQVTPARTSYVSDPNMHELEQQDTPMVAVPPVSSDWRDTVDAARRDPEASPMKEKSFVITGMPPSGPEENQSETPGPDTVMTGASASPSPDAARRDEGAAAIQKDSVNLDRFNGNESPYSPRRRSVIDAKGVDVRLTPEDEQDVDNGNAPELEHVRQVPQVETAPGTERNGGGGFWDALSNCGRRRTMQKVLIALSVVVPCVLMFLIMFPLSFIYVDYYQLALRRTKSTGFVDTTEVYQPGCYVLGPDMEFRYFQKTANTMFFKKLEVMTVDRLTFSLTFSFQYYFIEDKIGKVYDMFEDKFEAPFKSIATSTIKNECVKFSLDEFRKERPRIEKHFHDTLKRRFLGQCSTCTQSYYVDVRYFQLGFLDTPEPVMERLLVRSVAAELAATEKFKLEYAVVNKETDRQVQLIENEAAEILANSTAHATYIRSRANVAYDVTKTVAHMNGLKSMCQNISITRNDHMMTMYYLSTIKQAKHVRVVPEVAYKSMWTQLS